MVKKKETKKEREKKEEKKKFFLSEAKAFFILIIIFALIVGGVFLWYKFADKIVLKEEPKPKTTVKEKQYAYNRYTRKNAEFKIIGDYILDIEDNELHNILNLDGDVIKKFSEPQSYTNAYLGLDEKLYIENLIYSDFATENSLELYSFDGKKYNEVYNEEDAASIFSPIKYKKSDKYYLLGYIKEYNGEDKKELYLLNKSKKISLENVNIESSEYLNETKKEYVTYNKDYMIASSVTTKDKKYGSINLSNGKIAINLTYDELYQTKNGNYIAKNNDKVGIINNDLKKLVPYDYDFIDDQGNYYVVSKNNKLAIMDKNYKLITDFVFDYQKYNATSDNNGYIYKPDSNTFNSFKSYEIKDKYLLVINNNSNTLSSNNQVYKKNEAYLIDKTGKYKVIPEDEIVYKNNFIYKYENKNYNVTIYDKDMNEKFTFSLNDYDLKENKIDVNLLENIIIVNTNGVNLYYDYETGKQIDKPIYSYKHEDLEMKIDIKNNNIDFYKNNKKEFNLEIDNILDNFKIYNNKVYIMTKGVLVVEKEV